MSETWYCYQKKQRHRTDEVKVVTHTDPPEEEKQWKMEKLRRDGYMLIRKQELGNTKKCKDNAV